MKLSIFELTLMMLFRKALYYWMVRGLKTLNLILKRIVRNDVGYD